MNAEECAKELREQAAGMLELADFIEKNPDLPSMPYVGRQIFNVYLTDTTTKFEDGNWISVHNEEQSKKNLKQFLTVVKNCDKVYGDSNVTLTKKFGAVVLAGYLNREMVCEKKVVDKQWVEPKQVEGYHKEVIEWSCNEPSLLELVKDVA